MSLTQPACADDPVTTLLNRCATELSAEIAPDRPAIVSRAPGRLDVMGGIADYTGSMVCEFPLDRATAVISQERADRQLRIFSFNCFDAHQPSTFCISLEALATQSAETLRREFAAEGQTWAAYLIGCAYVLHDRGFSDLNDPRVPGLTLAVYSTVPAGAGISSSAALEAATMMNLRARWFGNAPRRAELDDPIQLARLCQLAENQVVGAPCGIMDQVTSLLGQSGKLLRMVCQPHEMLPALALPPGMRVIGIDSGVRHRVAGGAYIQTRCAAFMAHRIMLETMRDMGRSAGRELDGDPMRGYLANLDPDDYKRLFRPRLPDSIGGEEFLSRYGPTIDVATTIEPSISYAVRRAADHHVLEARRVRRFAEFLQQSTGAEERQPGAPLDRAGHLMYASHQSYTMDAMLGAPECDLLVSMLRKREPAGLYGARITGGGSGGTVALLCDQTARADEAISAVMDEYERRTGHHPELFAGSSDGAWITGTDVARLSKP